VNVTVENLGPCKKLLRFDISAEDIQKAMDEVTQEFAKHGSVPGFRAGKAPVHMVARQFEKSILDEAKTKVMATSYQQAIKEHKFTVVGIPDVETPEESKFAKDKSYQFIVKLETAPDSRCPTTAACPRAARSRWSPRRTSRAPSRLCGRRAAATRR